MKNIPSRQIQLGVWGCCKPPPVGPGQSPGGGPGAKPPEALKSPQSTLPEVVKKYTLVVHFCYVLHLKVTEKIIKIQNKVKTFSKQCRPITSFY